MKINLNRGQKLWFTSDTHYNHGNICSATTQWIDPVTCREFKSLEHMNAVLVANINEVVGQDDILFHLGDWSFGGFESIAEFRNKIICQNIHLITGNHDHHIENNRNQVQNLFSSVNKYLELVVKTNVGTPLMDEQKFVLMHFPIASWNNMAKGAIHLHGHIHLDQQKRFSPGKMMDVGVDGNNLHPISMNEVISLMKNRPIKSVLPQDHHTVLENYSNRLP
jgi:calcineurin-like phosphoesterase family protein